MGKLPRRSIHGLEWSDVSPLMEDPKAIDVLGNPVDKEPGLIEEAPPRIEQQGAWASVNQLYLD